MLNRTTISIAVATILACISTSHAYISMETVSVGNVGYGQVDYTYDIGKFEVTAGQYTEFLSAIATTDTYGLYNPAMWSNDYGCKIEQFGTAPNFSYSVAPDWANRPVNFISWADAARFANWMHNGQPTGPQDASTTEDGSYFVDGAMTQEEILTIERQPLATWVIPTRDEWRKAAFHRNDGTGGYHQYPTSSDIPPSNNLSGAGNNATYYNGIDHTIGAPYWRTEVGAHLNSPSPYGTFDQAGNVAEWNEDVVASYRALSGGSFDDDFISLHVYGSGHPDGESQWVGLRVGLIPEPASLALLALGCLMIAGRRPR